jgi:hypothetical protein
MRRAAVLLVPLLALACGKTGPLRPPAPHGPLPPVDVAARQIGAAVEIAFTVPDPRGKEPGQRVARAEILRVAYPKGVTPSADPDAFRVRGEVVAQVSGEPVSPGRRLVIADPSLGSLADAGIGWTLRYGVRVTDERDRPSALVVARDLATVPAVAAPRGLEGRPTADGVRLSWQAPAGEAAATYNVYRGPAEGTLSEQPLNVKPLTDRDYLDTSAQSGTVYRYVVRAVAAEGTPYRESTSSEPAIIDAKDVFPPAAPGGLVAVQEGKAVRLLWNPGTERDLDGYRVYRKRGDGPWTRIGADPVRQPTYLDAAVAAGDVLDYRVTAVDRADPPNESAPSEVATLRVSAEPGPPGAP